MSYRKIADYLLMISDQLCYVLYHAEKTKDDFAVKTIVDLIEKVDKALDDILEKKCPEEN